MGELSKLGYSGPMAMLACWETLRALGALGSKACRERAASLAIGRL